jgi:choline dehydrogenase-like flavoprotein
VLDPNCRAHDVENLYVTDGSFMPTGGSVPYTWTIYANAFRVADKILSELGGVPKVTT